jgi:hypothetical protein
MNFAKVASEYKVKRIIYLGGLIHAEDDDEDKLSEHMRSRREIGEILQHHSSSKVTIFRAAVILGQGGDSFQMLQYLVERLPVMICPRWVLTKCQPIAVDDVVEYLARCIEVKDTEGKRFDIGGPDILTYLDMMRKYAKILNKSVQIVIIPFLTPRLSSYWVDLVTPVRASLARPLIDSLKHDATVQDDSIRQLIPIQLKSFDEAIRAARNEKAHIKQPNRHVKERSTQKINSKLLMLSLLAMAAIGFTYYRWKTGNLQYQLDYPRHVVVSRYSICYILSEVRCKVRRSYSRFIGLANSYILAHRQLLHCMGDTNHSLISGCNYHDSKLHWSGSCCACYCNFSQSVS